jgi:type VII secretion protein EccB
MALFGSLLIGAIVLAAVGIYGFINPSGGTAPPGGIVIMRETGARYAVADDGLHPVLNWSSALLFADNPTPTVKTMSRRSLRRYPIGFPIGIPGAPDPPPDARSLVRTPWTVCSVRGDGPAPLTRTAIGWAPPGGSDVSTGSLVVTTGGTGAARHLIWNNRVHQLSEPAVDALGLASITPLRVSDDFLTSIPAGAPLRAPVIPGAGTPSPKLINNAPGTIGQLYRTGDQHYVLLASGLSPVGPVMTALLRAASTLRVEEVSAGAAAQARTTERIDPVGFPDGELPRPRASGAQAAMVCSQHLGEDGAAVSMAVELFDRVDSRLPGGADGTANRIVLDAGRGALVRVLPAPGVPPTAETTLYLVTDQGIRFPLGSAAAANALGYGGVTPVRVPAYLLDLVPVGPTLDLAAARRAAPAPSGPSRPPAPASTPRPSATGSRTAGVRQ